MAGGDCEMKPEARAASTTTAAVYNRHAIYEIYTYSAAQTNEIRNRGDMEKVATITVVRWHFLSSLVFEFFFRVRISHKMH